MTFLLATPGWCERNAEAQQIFKEDVQYQLTFTQQGSKSVLLGNQNSLNHAVLSYWGKVGSFGGKLAVTDWNEWYGGYYHQCVGFIKAVSDVNGWYSNYPTSGWIRGNSVNTFTPLWSVIATFSPQGKYNYGHTAILVGFYGNSVTGGIEVIDQNFYDHSLSNGSYIARHQIPWNSSSPLQINSASQYNIVRVP